MDSIKFSRDELLAVIRKNRTAHQDEFQTAIAGYEVEATKRLKDLVKKMKAGEHPSLMVNLIIPVDHTSDYDRIIKMLEMSQETTVILDEHDFGQYVQDDWSWKHQFHTSNASYMSAGSAALAKKKS